MPIAELLLEILGRFTWSFPHGWARQNHSAKSNKHSRFFNIKKQFNKQTPLNRRFLVQILSQWPLWFVPRSCNYSPRWARNRWSLKLKMYTELLSQTMFARVKERLLVTNSLGVPSKEILALMYCKLQFVGGKIAKNPIHFFVKLRIFKVALYSFTIARTPRMKV